jgi:hypothetical protein
MKKKNLKTLNLNKKAISNFSTTLIGGREVSIHETNCDYCPIDSPSNDTNTDDNGGGGTHTCTTFRSIISCLVC